MENELAVALLRQYSQTGDLGLLPEAARSLRIAVADRFAGPVERVEYLFNLAYTLERQLEDTEQIDDADLTDIATEWVVTCREFHHLLRGNGLCSRDHLDMLLRALWGLYGITRNRDLLAETIAACRDALGRLPADRSDRTEFIEFLYDALRLWQNATGDYSNFDEIVELDRILAPKRRIYDVRTGRQTIAYLDLSVIDGDPTVVDSGEQVRVLAAGKMAQVALENAIMEASRTLERLPAGHPQRGVELTELSVLCRILYTEVGDYPVLIEAVAAARAAVAETREGTSERGLACLSLGQALDQVYVRTRMAGALDESIQVVRQATELVSSTESMCPSAHLTLAIVLGRQYERTRRAEVLDEAIRTTNMALGHVRADHPEWAQLMGDISEEFRKQYDLGGDSHLLAMAVDLARDGASATPEDSPRRAYNLNRLSRTLVQDHQRSGSLDSLDEAIRWGRLSLSATVVGTPFRTVVQSGLSAALVLRYQRTKQLPALEEAITLERAALRGTHADDSDRVILLSNLGELLRILHRHTQAQACLAESIRYAREAVTAGGENDPNLAGFRWRLVRSLLQTGEPTAPDCLDEISDNLISAFSSDSATLTMRITAGKTLCTLYIEAGVPDWVLMMLEQTIELLPRLAPRSLARSDRERSIEEATGLAALAAIAAIDAGLPRRAVELLEQTRGILIGQAIDERSDVSDLSTAAPELAARFHDLRRQLTALESSRDDKYQIGAERRRLDNRWHDLVREIRSLKGFRRFLQPPDYDELRTGIPGGVIVMVYAGIRNGGAVILRSEEDTPDLVPLPGLTADTVKQQVAVLRGALEACDGDDLEGRARGESALHELLEWEWDMIAAPVLRRLGEVEHIRWCLVENLAQLPIHAAGHHRGAPGGTLLDRVVSSFVATVRATVHAAARPPVAVNSSMIVGTFHADGTEVLAHAEQEVRLLERLLPNAHSLEGAHATYRSVTSELAHHAVVHFACHGIADPDDPAAGRLLLHDHRSTPLTVAAIAQLDLPGAELAYLSACSSAQSTSRLPDEMIHLAAAVHMAGFRQVVGALWPIDDAAASTLAIDFYSEILIAGTGTIDVSRCAEALTTVVRRMRNKYPALPSRWASHVIFGS